MAAPPIVLVNPVLGAVAIATEGYGPFVVGFLALAGIGLNGGLAVADVGGFGLDVVAADQTRQGADEEEVFGVSSFLHCRPLSILSTVTELDRGQRSTPDP